MAKYLRHKTKGTIYGWSINMAQVPTLEEVTEEEAFPERFAPKAAKGRKSKLDVESNIPADPDFTPIEIRKDASRGL